MATFTGMNLPVLASLPIFTCFAMVVTPIGNVAVEPPHPKTRRAPLATGNRRESDKPWYGTLPYGVSESSLGRFYNTQWG